MLQSQNCNSFYQCILYILVHQPGSNSWLVGSTTTTPCNSLQTDQYHARTVKKNRREVAMINNQREPSLQTYRKYYNKRNHCKSQLVEAVRVFNRFLNSVKGGEGMVFGKAGWIRIGCPTGGGCHVTSFLAIPCHSSTKTSVEKITMNLKKYWDVCPLIHCILYV